MLTGGNKTVSSRIIGFYTKNGKHRPITARKENPKFRPGVEMKSWRERLEREGFIDVGTLTRKERAQFVRMLYQSEDIRVQVRVLRSTKRDSATYASPSLFGRRKIIIYYLPWAKDRVSEYLSNLFLKANPSPERYLRVSFTRFMHDSGLEPKIRRVSLHKPPESSYRHI